MLTACHPRAEACLLDVQASIMQEEEAAKAKGAANSASQEAKLSETVVSAAAGSAKLFKIQRLECVFIQSDRERGSK